MFHVSFNAFKGPRYVLTEGSAEGRNVFLGPGYPHKDSRLPTYSDCMQSVQSVALRCHSDAMAARPLSHPPPTNTQMKISSVFTHAVRPVGGGQRLVSVSLALRLRLKNGRLILARPCLSPPSCLRGFVNPVASSVVSAFHRCHVTESR